MVTIVLGILTGIMIGCVGLLTISVLVVKHEEKKKRKMIEMFLNGLAEGLKQNEDDGK